MGHFVKLVGLITILAWVPRHGKSQELPRLTLRMDNVTLSQALVRISRAGGWLIELSGYPMRLEDIPPSGPTYSFRFQNEPIGRVFRAVADKYVCSMSTGSEYQIRFSEEKSLWPPSPIRTKVGEYTVTLEEIFRNRVVYDKPLPGLDPIFEGMNMVIDVRADSGDARSIFTVDNIRRPDQAGRKLGIPERLNSRMFNGGSPLDEHRWFGNYDGPQGASTVIPELHGDIVRFRERRYSRLEAHLEPFDDKTLHTVGQETLRILAYNYEPGRGVGIKYEVAWTPGWVAMTTNEYDVGRALIRLQSGRVVAIRMPWNPVALDYSSRTVDGYVSLDSPTDRPVTLVVDLFLFRDPYERIPFVLKNVPLPPINGYWSQKTGSILQSEMARVLGWPSAKSQSSSTVKD